MKLLASAVMISMCTGTLAGTPATDLVRTSDKLHLDVRELIQRGADDLQVYARVDLCAVGAKRGDAAVCSPLTTVGPATVAGRGQSPATIVKYPDGNQSVRVLGPTINTKGRELAAKVTGDPEYRLVLTVQSTGANGVQSLATRQFAKLPPLDQEGPAAERGAMIDRHTFESPDKSFSGRVLIVLTRSNP